MEVGWMPAHGLGGWCVYCSRIERQNAAMLATFDFEGWAVTCDRCGRTREQAIFDYLRVLEDEAATKVLLALRPAIEAISSADEPRKLVPAKIYSP